MGSFVAILDVTRLEVFYRDFQALHGIDLSVDAGEIVSVVGANGAGKSTLLKSIAGLLKPRAGEIRFKDAAVTGQPAPDLVARGISLIPEGRRLFPSLSVLENLLVGGQVKRRGPWTLKRVFGLFPILEERQSQSSRSLSGGQQQMVAIGRALMSNPDLLLCDELSLGLAPIIVRDIFKQLPSIVSEGSAIVIVEQDVSQAKAATNRMLCIRQGRTALSGKSAELDLASIRAAYFGV
jgi:branched-chain amino acid transport system ATP-binding protein